MAESARDRAGPATVPPAPGRSRPWGVAGATALGTAIALATAHSLLGVITTAIPAPADCSGSRCGDHALLLWLMTQAGRSLYTHPLTLFEAPVFHPMRHALAFSESMLSAAVFTGPLGWLTGNPMLAYNLHYLGVLVLSVVGMYLLVREITGDARAAFVAGGLFGLATERGLWWEFPPALALQWGPILVWTWLRFLAAPSRGRGVALAVALVAHMHAAAYHGLMLPALLAPWALVLIAAGPWPWRRWLASAIPLGIGGALGAALYYPYLVVGEELQYAPSGIAIALPDQYATGIVHPLEYLAWRVHDPGTGFFVSPLAPYLVAAALVVAAIVRRPGGPRRLGAHLAAATLLTVLAMLVSFGPVLATSSGVVPGPLALLQLLPGFAAMRAVVRFMMLAAFGRTLAAGIATAILLRRLPAWAGTGLCAIVLGLAAVDARLDIARPVHDFSVPAAWAPGYDWLAGTLPDTPIIELPYGTFGDDARAMVHSLWHRRPIMNGYAAVIPRFTDVTSRLPDDVGWRALQAAGVRYVLVHPSAMEDNPLTLMQLQRLDERADLVVASFEDTVVLAVPPAFDALDPPLGDPLPRGDWRVEGSAPGAALAVDGDLATHWVANSAAADASLRIDLGRAANVSAILLDLGPHLLEYPRQYEVRASLDGTEWTTIGSESPTLPPFASYRQDHRHLTLRLHLRPTVARWLELVVPAYPPNSWAYSSGQWAVHELRIFESPAARRPVADAPAPPTAAP